MAGYNCENTTDNAYGAGAYSTCEETVAAPNTGLLPITGSDDLLYIVMPLILAVAIGVYLLATRRRKKTANAER